MLNIYILLLLNIKKIELELSNQIIKDYEDIKESFSKARVKYINDKNKNWIKKINEFQEKENKKKETDL